MSHQSDEWLMGQVRAGKRDCLEPLVRRYASSLLTYLHRMLGNRHRSEELFQEVFLKVWEKRTTYKLPKAFKPWLFAIATNCCRADFRKARLSNVALYESDPILDTEQSSPLDAAVNTESSTIINAAVRQLPTQQRTVVVLRIWNQMSFAEIARTVGRSEGTVRSNMHHGLASLRETLGSTLGLRANAGKGARS